MDSGRSQCANLSFSSWPSAHAASSPARVGPQGSASPDGTLSRRSGRPAALWAAISSRCQPANTGAPTYAHKPAPLALSHAAATVNASVIALAAVDERAQIDLLCPVSLEYLKQLNDCPRGRAGLWLRTTTVSLSLPRCNSFRKRLNEKLRTDCFARNCNSAAFGSAPKREPRPSTSGPSILVVVTGNFLHEDHDPEPQGGIINSHERFDQP